MCELRSRSSTEPAFARFVNKTHRWIDVIWINYIGGMEKYGTLSPNQFLDVNTYKSHPWIFVDRFSGERMMAESKTVYYAQSFNDFCLMYPDIAADLRDIRAVRRQVFIHLPLFTLCETSSHVVLNSLRNISDIELLELPFNLRNDLRVLGVNKETLRAIPMHSNVSCRGARPNAALPRLMFLFWKSLAAILVLL